MPLINLLEEYKRTVDLTAIVSKTDPAGKITYVNEQFEEISGYRKDELLGKYHNIIRHPDMSDDIFKDLWRTIKIDKKPWFGKIKNRKKDGSAYYVDTVINPILDQNGNIIKFIAVRKDITDIMNPKKQLLDEIANMENPILILSKIGNYKIIKEFYTEDIRSEFEEYFSKKLLSFLPKSLEIKKVYILGDGLFGFLRDGKETNREIELYLLEVLNKLKQKYLKFGGNKYQVDVHFSFALKGLNQYDDALIGIKRVRKGKDNILYAKELSEESQKDARKKLKTLTLIKDSLQKSDRVVSFYQPIICNQTKEIVKYESLIRIITNKEEVLSPFHFMEIAKKTGYYHDITYKVIENASKILNIIKNIKISINLSASDIEDFDVRNLLMNLISKEDNKGRITFELLEDENTKDITLIEEFIKTAKKIGNVKISIDDFGSGYSNYERLSMFQPDFIKIDGSLVKDILTNKYNESVVKSIVLFAKENSIKTIAEFVSSEEIYEKIKDLGVDYSQGFLFGKPEPMIL